MLEIIDLGVRYGRQAVLEQVNLTVYPARTVGVIGPNGAGKSTLLKAILGLLPASGSVRLGGRPLVQVREQVAYVPQRAGVDWDFPATVEEVVRMGAVPRLGWLGRLGNEQRARAAEALEQVGMTGFAQRRIGELSGGQQQRVFLARALVQQARLLLFDEPFLGVDRTTEEALLSVFDALRAEGCTLLVVNHDLGEVVNRYDDILLLRNRVVAYGPRETTFTRTNLDRAYLGLATAV